MSDFAYACVLVGICLVLVSPVWFALWMGWIA